MICLLSWYWYIFWAHLTIFNKIAACNQPIAWFIYECPVKWTGRLCHFCWCAGRLVLFFTKYASCSDWCVTWNEYPWSITLKSSLVPDGHTTCFNWLNGQWAIVQFFQHCLCWKQICVRYIHICTGDIVKSLWNIFQNIFIPLGYWIRPLVNPRKGTLTSKWRKNGISMIMTMNHQV